MRDDLIPSVKGTGLQFKYTKEQVKRIIESQDPDRIREVSDYFFKASGIYKRIIWLFSGMFNFDNIVIPHLKDQGYPENKLINDFQKVLDFVDNLFIKNLLKNITFSVFKDGVYYGYLRNPESTPSMQKLPPQYCRSRYKKNGRFVVEFDIRYFDREFPTTEARRDVLKKFPQEFVEYYTQYKMGTLNIDRSTDREWVLLDVDKAICFKFPDGMPFFVGSIIDLMELREYKDVEMQRDKLALFLLLVQKIPMSKEGEMLFDTAEARELHKNALKMLESNEQVDVLTTFADIDMIDLQESRQTIKDNLQKAERGVFNETGVSRMLFATEGNISLEKSIQSNELIVRYLIEMYSDWLTHIVNAFIKTGPKYWFEVWLPPVTIFNEEEMEDKYKEQAKLGYSKILPAVVGGMKQSSILNLLKFENEVLSLGDSMIPLKSTHTQSGNSDKGGRPPKEEDEKDDETIKNLEGAK